MPSFWLPDLITLQDYGGNWERYLDALHGAFVDDFVSSSPTFRGVALRLKRHPMEQGKEATFWHMISEGHDEQNRTPDLRRCERIRWPRAIIEHSTDPAVKVWTNQRTGRGRGAERRILLWVEEEEYLVVLAQRPGYILPWTAYLVREEYSKRKLRREYETFLKTGAAL